MVPSRASVGFSLVEILVVITIIGLLMTLGFGAVQNAMEAGKVTTCQDHLRQMGQAMTLFVNQRNKGRWPREGGIRFLLTLYRTKQLTGKNSDIFLCPGTTDENDAGPGTVAGAAYDDWENLDPASISYAGRDVEAFPIRGSMLEQIILASDDNEFMGNHRVATNYLYADGSVDTFDIAIDGGDLLEAFPEYEQLGLPIGPDSPHEPFQVLRID